MAKASVTTRQSNLNVRSGPSTSHSIIGKLGKGTEIEIGETFSEGGWTWVSYNGGWVCQKDPRYSYPFLNIVAEEPEEVIPAPPEPAPAPTMPDYSGITAELLSQYEYEGVDIRADRTYSIDDSAVQYENKKLKAKKDTSNDIWKPNKYKGQMTKDQLLSIERKSPEYYQNKTGYPRSKGFNKFKGYYEYDYKMDYDRDNLSSDLQGLRNSLNLGIEGRDQLYRQYTEFYNRFKLPNPNDSLHKTFSHVFFVRPDCNILRRTGSGTFKLIDGLQNDPNMYYAFHHAPELLRQLVDDAGYDHDFMLYLSNKAKSFQLNDESITYDTYGKTLTGHKIAYGKTNIDSKTAGDFSITYTDDRDLHVFHIHKLWADYISHVYQGNFNPKEKYMLNKILDYVANVYFIMTAEDGETVIFWSKYYGVFPVTIPSSQYSWSAGNTLTNPDFDVRYQYSFKEDFNPLSIVEFNMNSGSNNLKYIPTINRNNYTPNTTWVGAPFIETFNNGTLAPYTFKLRFKSGVDIKQMYR